MWSLEHKQYGGDYQPCTSCSISFPAKSLIDARCVNCQPQHSCISCLVTDSFNLNCLECTEGVWRCKDLLACAERFWRVNAKAADTRADQFARSQKPLGNYTHHNTDCDYRNGRWICTGFCLVANK